MRQTLVPVLLLAAVALSSSNVLPITQRLDPNEQNDNTLSYKYNKAFRNNIFYTPVATSENNRLMRNLAKYLNANRHRTEESYNDIFNEDDNYDGEGFRKEQWHNYPRQLDRLHAYLSDYRNTEAKRNSDTDDPGIEYNDPAESKERALNDIPTNEHLHDGTEDDIYNSVAPSDALLVLKVHLACLSNRLKNTPNKFQTQLNNENETNGLEEKLFTNEINPATKVKREGVASQETENSDEDMPNKKKSKRLFSLWSRLQTLSHKGHELPHRRHLAYYGFPNGEGGGTLTAETRGMMRPPGSPLRWG